MNTEEMAMEALNSETAKSTLPAQFAFPPSHRLGASGQRPGWEGGAGYLGNCTTRRRHWLVNGSPAPRSLSTLACVIAGEWGNRSTGKLLSGPLLVNLVVGWPRSHGRVVVR